MMTGEFEFDSYYTPETLGSASPLYYKQISFIMFFVFIVIVPIVFMNLLVRSVTRKISFLMILNSEERCI